MSCVFSKSIIHWSLQHGLLRAPSPWPFNRLAATFLFFSWSRRAKKHSAKPLEIDIQDYSPRGQLIHSLRMHVIKKKKTCACISKDFALNLSSNSNLHKLLKTLQYSCFQKFKASPKPKFKETRLHSLMVATVVMSQNGVSTGVGRITVAAYANRLAESKLKV